MWVKLFKGKFDRPQLANPQNPPVDRMLPEAEEVRSHPPEQQ
ncbi:MULTISPECIES: hypothetical protein [unclassified Microcoleus]|nr:MULTISPECIES: hypothetical protein [unclassified Microcoleus]